MIINEFKTIFIHVRKTAGTSIVHTLLPGLVGYETSGPMLSLPKAIRRKYGLNINLKHASAIELQDKMKKHWNDYYKFSFIRNPWDRTVSAYHWAHRAGKRFANITFNEYIQLIPSNQNNPKHPLNHLFRSQMSFLTSLNGNVMVNDIFPFENLTESLKQVGEKTGISIDPIKKHNTTKKRKPYQEYYTAKTRDVVNKYYKDDIEIFNYQFTNDQSIHRNR